MTFKFDFDTLTFDLAKLTAGQAEDFYAKTDMDITELLEAMEAREINGDNWLKNTHLLLPFLWIAVRQTTGDNTIDYDVLRNEVPLFDLALVFEVAPLDELNEQIEAAKRRTAAAKAQIEHARREANTTLPPAAAPPVTLEDRRSAAQSVGPIQKPRKTVIRQ